MYRVELKEPLRAGVEGGGGEFLMYRVELKDLIGLKPPCMPHTFLMYRVELKAHISLAFHARKQVPNVPCGVES